MTVKITTLIENNPGANPALKNEHGLSFFIEKEFSQAGLQAVAPGGAIKNCIPAQTSCR